jgi:hypothetical protein
MRNALESIGTSSASLNAARKEQQMAVETAVAQRADGIE